MPGNICNLSELQLPWCLVEMMGVLGRLVAGSSDGAVLASSRGARNGLSTYWVLASCVCVGKHLTIAFVPDFVYTRLPILLFGGNTGLHIFTSFTTFNRKWKNILVV